MLYGSTSHMERSEGEAGGSEKAMRQWKQRDRRRCDDRSRGWSGAGHEPRNAGSLKKLEKAR